LISTDEEKLEKIISNLIYNAVKFNSEEGSITLTARLSDDKKMVTIAVSDTGMGIDEKDLPHIFDRYYQSNSSAAKAKGAGIGLSLVKEFTNLLGGQVHVSSKPGVGTTFTLQFPVFEDQVRETIAGSEFSIPEVNLRFQQPYIILIVEDNAEMRYYLKEVLSGSINLMEAENGKAALAWLANNHADMVISDIMMPEMDGKEFIATLKENDKYRKIPIITVSALSDMENQLGLLGLGVDDYIVKPFNAMELRIRVRNLLVNLEERNAFDRQPAEPDDVSKDSIQAAEFKQKIQDYVLARIKNYDVTVYDVAYEFSLSERQLYRLSKSLTGLTAAQLIKEIRLQKAYELLINRQVAKVETVARELGFENASYFTRQFTERFGKRPSEFL
jgi:DNA-binding response OmpR family regulator/anti-sigma regulatory factor (Ser/Thr protein kinase)